MRPDTDPTRGDALDAIWLEDWERAQTILLLAIVDQLAAISEVLTADAVIIGADPKPARP